MGYSTRSTGMAMNRKITALSPVPTYHVISFLDIGLFNNNDSRASSVEYPRPMKMHHTPMTALPGKNRERWFGR